MKAPTDVLRDEHAIILNGLALLEVAASRLEGGDGPPASWWDDVLGWLRVFADRNHHAKEERCLFPAMTKAGVPAESGPIEVMLEEHAQGRALLQAMATVDARQRARATRRYVQLLRDHIDKEQGIVFPLAEAVLDEPAVEEVAHAFEIVETENSGAASLLGAAAALERLTAVLDVPVAR